MLKTIGLRLVSRLIKEFMKILITIIFFMTPVIALSQTVECPPNLICLSQEAANKARDNALELKAVKDKVVVLEQALKLKDQSIEELTATMRRNDADLKEALKKTEIELGLKTGQLIARESEVVRQSQIIQAMIPMLRKKKIGLINIW